MKVSAMRRDGSDLRGHHGAQGHPLRKICLREPYTLPFLPNKNRRAAGSVPISFVVTLKDAVWSAKLHGGREPEMGYDIDSGPILRACFVFHSQPLPPPRQTTQ